MEDNNYLAHYGVKGMRWGVRRTHNSDGTLNKRGKRKFSRINKRYGKAVKKQDKQINRYERAMVRNNSKRLRKNRDKLLKRNRKVLKLERKLNRFGMINEIPEGTRMLGKMELDRLMRY